MVEALSALLTVENALVASFLAVALVVLYQEAREYLTGDQTEAELREVKESVEEVAETASVLQTAVEDALDDSDEDGSDEDEQSQ